MPQAATTGNLASAQRTIIATSRYTEEHNAPAMALIEHMTLPKGASTMTVPKVGQMTLSDLVDGQDIVDEEDIGMTTVDLTSSEVGAKVVLTDKLVRQMNEDVYRIIGRQFGDASSRKKDTDVHALYSALNGGTTLGVTTASLTITLLSACIAYAKSNKFGSQLYVLHHPNAVYSVVRSGAVTPSATYPVPDGWSADLLKNFYSGLKPVNGVGLFEDGNLSVNSSSDAIGVIADKSALVVLESMKTRTERQRDASLRATEVVIVADYGVFELDDSRGAAMTYAAGAIATT